MKSLKEVLKGVEAFVKDMKDLGLDVSVGHGVDARDVSKETGVIMIRLDLPKIEEDLEVPARGR